MGQPNSQTSKCFGISVLFCPSRIAAGATCVRATQPCGIPWRPPPAPIPPHLLKQAGSRQKPPKLSEIISSLPNLIMAYAVKFSGGREREHLGNKANKVRTRDGSQWHRLPACGPIPRQLLSSQVSQTNRPPESGSVCNPRMPKFAAVLPPRGSMCPIKLRRCPRTASARLSYLGRGRLSPGAFSASRCGW